MSCEQIRLCQTFSVVLLFHWHRHVPSGAHIIFLKCEDCVFKKKYGLVRFHLTNWIWQTNTSWKVDPLNRSWVDPDIYIPMLMSFTLLTIQKNLCKLLLWRNFLKWPWVWNFVNCLTSKVFLLILQFHSGLLALSLPDPRVNTTSLELVGVHWLPDLYLSNSGYL